jgi:WD40 repeat protein
MNDSLLNDACLNSCKFIESDLRDIKYGRYPDFIGHKDVVNSIVFSDDSKYLASGSYDNTVKLWNVETQKDIFTLQGYSLRVTSIAFSPDSKYLVSGSDDKTIKLWNVEA